MGFYYKRRIKKNMPPINELICLIIDITKYFTSIRLHIQITKKLCGINNLKHPLEIQCETRKLVHISIIQSTINTNIIIL